MNHEWDYPKSKLSARCKKCDVLRLNEKYLGRFGWVYYKGFGGLPIFKCPPCKKIEK